MTYEDFIYLNPDFQPEILLQVFKILGTKQVLELYGTLSKENFEYVNNLYIQQLYIYITTKAVSYNDLLLLGIFIPLDVLLLMIKVTFYSDRAPNAPHMRIPIEFYTSTKMLLYYASHFWVLIYHLIHPEQIFYDKVNEIFAVHILTNIMQEFEFLLILHEILADLRDVDPSLYQ